MNVTRITNHMKMSRFYAPGSIPAHTHVRTHTKEAGAFLEVVQTYMRQRTEDWEFEISLGYSETLSEKRELGM
jgi:hypothetical protein